MSTIIQLKRNLKGWLNCKSLKYVNFVTKIVVAYRTNQSFIATFTYNGKPDHISYYPSNYLIDEFVFRWDGWLKRWKLKNFCEFTGKNSATTC